MGKSCYIIGPIGEPESKEREWADFVKKHIIEPVVKGIGYDPPQRSDEDHAEAIIMTGIIQKMFEADLVIADLTGNNPNVFYELGIRNCARKPVIHLIQDGQSPPFDLKGNRAIFVGRDHEIVLKAHEEITNRIEAIEKKPEQFYSHVQIYMQTKELDVLKKEGSEKEGKIADTLRILLTLAESNSGMLVRLNNAIKEKPKRSLAASYLDSLNITDNAKAEIKDDRSSVTKTEPMDINS
jgi:nucleoside 2-deoxyribosyltransferase